MFTMTRRQQLELQLEIHTAAYETISRAKEALIKMNMTREAHAAAVAASTAQAYMNACQMLLTAEPSPEDR